MATGEYVPTISKRAPPQRRQERSRSPDDGVIVRRVSTAIRHGGLWYDDGDIVITAAADGHSDGTKAFRVHKEKLLGHSDLLDRIIQESKLSIQFSGDITPVPCASLPEPAAEVEQFLVAMYTFDEHFDEAYAPAVITNILGGSLRLAKHYQVSSLETKLRLYVLKFWPYRLEHWDDRENNYSSKMELYPSGIYEGRFLEDYSFQEPATAIHLAKECNIAEILPVAFYDLSRIPRQNHWSERRSFFLPFSQSPSHYSPQSRTARWDLLSEEDCHILISFSRRIERFVKSIWDPAKIMNKCGPSCQDPDFGCLFNIYAVTNLWEPLPDELDLALPFDPLTLLHRRCCRPTIEIFQQEYCLCTACATEFTMSVVGKSALIIGATGQVGRHLLQELLQDSSVTRVGEYGRRVTPVENIKAGKEKLEQKSINFEKIDEEGLKDGKWDVVYITLGTTRAAAGSAAAFEKIDREYVVNAARAAKVDDPNHPQRLVYLSSARANADSSMLYFKSKGLTELSLAKLGYSETMVFRPNTLTGSQREDFRPIEHVAFALLKLRASWARNYSCPVEIAAKAMCLGGGLGAAKFPEAIAPYISKEGGATPFTAIENVGHRVLVESLST
ncbi:Protein fmp52, mitochondrial [Steccherinum ochraceum]|uniref:Protein fmp52, mitochondrial n=1 Tax=Steccherinum ochraceum TaxID=92696 RepID=A0A4V2MXQ3_9APHY|nr:Protein fmp52, mitochondrial [Steccherinum ochraceum]